MRAKITEILTKTNGRPGLETELDRGAHLMNEIGLDSLQAINFILRVEEEL